MLKAKHQQMFDILKEEFLHGDWPYGKKLPRLTELAKKYSVSINIASRAVDLLKEAGMVETKVGDGVYSTFKVCASINSFHYAGERIYGHYRGAKTLRILVEDSADWQIAFWNRFFQEFSSENPDIEIEVDYRTKEEESFEAYIGGQTFIQKMVAENDKVLAADWVNTFVPDLYQDCIYALKDFSGLLPYGFSAQQMLAISGTPAPDPQENILDYLERLPDSMQGYIVRSSRQLLASMEVDVSKIGTDTFTAADAKNMLSVFERAEKLYSSGRLLWPHGKVVDMKQMHDLLKNRQVQAVGASSNTINFYRNDPSIQILPYPHGRKPAITMHYMHISADTLYPEEYLRLLKYLLSAKIQKQAEKERIFYSIRKDVSFEESNALRQAILNGNIQLPYENTESCTDAFFNFLGWEFYYYLEGRRGPEVIELIHQKIRYYYEHIKNKGKETL